MNNSGTSINENTATIKMGNVLNRTFAKEDIMELKDNCFMSQLSQRPTPCDF